MKKIWTYIAEAVTILAFGAIFAVVVVEWFAGCGESYIDANGVSHQYECVFL